jgi:hypothetical protein
VRGVYRRVTTECQDAEPPGGAGGRGTHLGPDTGPRGESPATSYQLALAGVGLFSFGPNPTANPVGANEGGSAVSGKPSLARPS